MPKVAPIQSSFSSGEFSPLLFGGVDNERYKAALATCKNYVPTTQGGLLRRPGTYFVWPVKDSTKETRLIPFEFSTTQAYMLEFGHQYIRFYKDNGIITLTETNITGATQANPVVVTSNAHGYSNGDRIAINSVSGMTQLNNREFTVANVTANTYELAGINGTGFSAYTSGGTAGEIYEISSPYAEADLFQIKYTQSADVLYITHPTYAPRKLTRTGHTSWTLTEITFLDGPYLNTNSTTTTLTPSATTGTITVTASSVVGINNGEGFKVTDIGRLIRMKNAAVWGYMRITGFTSTTVVTASVQFDLGAASTVVEWRLGVWSTTTGFPGAVSFHEDRLFLAGCPGSPQRLDGSKTGDYENFAPTDTTGAVVASNAVSFSLNSNDVNLMRWLTSDEKGLCAGSVGGEWVVRPSSSSEAISPTNISAKRATSYGSSNIQPVQSGKATIFVQRAGRKIREMAYFYEVDGFKSNDLSILAEHITESGIKQMAFQKEPQAVIWCVREDGVLAGMTYERDLDALRVGWHRTILGGSSDAAGSDAIVESVAVIPAPDTTRQELWLVVQRYINGSVKRYVEYMDKFFEDTDFQRDAYFVDCGLTFDNPVTITAATQANPVVVTATAHGFSNGQTINITGIKGMTELNGENFTAANVTANTFELSGINGTSYSPYVSGGEARRLVTTISGLNHLEGETIAICADGAVQPDKVVTGGVVTLSVASAVVHLGYNYNSDAQMLRIDAGAANGTSIGKTRRTNKVGFMLHRTLGISIGTSFDDLSQITFRTAADPMTRAPALFSGIIQESLNADYDFENQICWRQSQPLPSIILAVMPEMTTND